MLVKLTDTKGLTYWLNPIHVKMLREKKGVTEIFLTINSSWPSPNLKVKEPLDAIAAMISAAMPENLSYVPGDDFITGSHGSTTQV